MQKLVFINGNGTQIDLTAGNFGVVNWAGLSNTSLNIQTQQVPFEDGGVFLDALMEQREIELTVAVYDGNNLSLRYQKKRELISALNPKLGEGVLIYTNDYISKQIKAVPQIPLFENKNSNDVGTLKASIAFSCPDPYWEDVNETEIILKDIQTTKINNNGDVPVNLKIDVIGDSNYLELNNITNGKRLIINNNISENVEIDTNRGQKNVFEDISELNNIIKGTLLTDAIYSHLLDCIICVGQKNNIVKIQNNNELEYLEIPDNSDEDIAGVAELGSYIYFCTTTKIIRTENLNSWETVYTLEAGNFNGIKAKFNKLIAYGTSTLYTSNGEDWVDTEISGTITNCNFNETTILLMGSTLLYKSNNAEDWTSISFSQTPYGKTLVVDNKTNTFYVLVGTELSWNKYRSTDNGETWTNLYGFESNVLGMYFSESLNKTVLLYKNGYYSDTEKKQIPEVKNVNLYQGFNIQELYNELIIGEHAIIKSSGDTFNVLASIPPLEIYSICKSDANIYLISGKTNTTGKILRSENLYIWEVLQVKINGSTISFSGIVRTVYNPLLNKFYAVNNKTIYSCDNLGDNWNLDYTSNNKTTYIATSTKTKNIWVTGNTDGSSLYSQDGTSWILTQPKNEALKVKYNEASEKFFFCSNKGTVYVATDGTSSLSMLFYTSYNNEFVDCDYAKYTDMVLVGGHFYTSDDQRIYYYDMKNNEFDVPTGFDLEYPVIVHYDENSNYMFAICNTKRILRSINTKNYTFWKNVVDVINDSYSGFFVGNNVIKKLTQKRENIIRKLSENSDMTFNLEIGKNELNYICSNSNEIVILRYRQKYIGV